MLQGWSKSQISDMRRKLGAISDICGRSRVTCSILARIIHGEIDKER